MAHSRHLFEGAALAAALITGAVALTQGAQAQVASQGPPKGADYQTSIQCAGLHSALAVFSPNDAAKNDERHAARFKEWAIMRAPEVNKTPGAVNSDVSTARKNFVRDAGKGPNVTRWKRLVELYNYQWNACRNMSDVREFIAVQSR